MLDIAEFLLARYAEDEAVARAATVGPWEVRPYWFTSNGRSWATVPDVVNEDIDARDAVHIAHWDPARVLAECEAKRRIVELHSFDLYMPVGGESSWEEEVQCKADREEWPCPTLRLLALPYTDHKDYREEWKP